MYTETQQALRNSLWNFMGSMLTASMLEDKRAKESVTALVSEELCKFCKNEDQVTIDINAAKPMLKSTIWILEARKQEMVNYQNEHKEEYIPMQVGIDNLNTLIESLKTYTDKI